MKKLYHKIPGVPLTVCTAEQKIAYNAAFRADINTNARELYKTPACVSCAVVRDTLINDFIGAALREIDFSRDAETIKGKYNFDMIAAALRAGAAVYLSGPGVLWDYNAIGKTFPALYLDTENK